MGHIRNDLYSVVDDKQFTLYNDGVMTMFAEAIKGSDGMIHSAGPAVFTALVDAIPGEEKSLGLQSVWSDVICGVLTSTIHHCRAEHFSQYEEAIYEKVEQTALSAQTSPPAWEVVPHIRILGTLAGVRKGSRISDWSRLIKQLTALLSKLSPAPEEPSHEQSHQLWNHAAVNVAIAWHHAPVDALISHIAPLVQALTREPLMKLFIPFCSYFCELNSRRFASLFRSDFQK
jgi:U3 small nucleolar RNA-associated protein 20